MKNERYKFSETTVAQFYGWDFFSIINQSEEIVAYSEKVFEIPDDVTLIGDRIAIIFKNAIIRGGEIRGGVIRGGVIRGGEIRGGVIGTTPLQIQGTRHFCYATPNPHTGEIELGIGCHIHQIEKWREEYTEIGKTQGYSPEEIAEYGEYIQLFAKRYGKAAY